MKTLLLLGGSRQQVVAIEAAKQCGYRTVLCDYLPDNPGQHHADAFYQVSTTDRDAILDVAISEHVDGVIAYSSDPASPTAAYVAEKLSLPTNPLKAVEIMSEKHLFREHLREANLPCPKAARLDASISVDELWEKVRDFRMPIVIKPTDSSGSKGVTVVEEQGRVADALAHARECSRNGVLIAEEYIEKGFPRVIGGDIFVADGEVRFWGLMACLRDEKCPLVPVGKVIPSGLSTSQWDAVRETLRQLVSSLGICFGELNVEIILDERDCPYVIELGSRAGGNMIPVQLSDASGVDLVKANVLCAMGEEPGDLHWEPSGVFYSTYVLHSCVDGLYRGIQLSPLAERCIYREVFYKEHGDRVERFDGANKAVGILFMKFDSGSDMEAFLADVEDHIKVLIEE